MPRMLGCVWYDMIGFAAGGASANHRLPPPSFFYSSLPFHCSYRISACECECMHALTRCEFSVCVRAWPCVCVYVGPVSRSAGGLQARVRLRSEISQISHCLCSFSIHALWFTTPRASHANDAAFSRGFLPELKHAFLVNGGQRGFGVVVFFYIARLYRRRVEGSEREKKQRKKKKERRATLLLSKGCFVFFFSLSGLLPLLSSALTLVFVFPQAAA